MSSDSYQTTILDVFLEYKQYYLDQITSKTLDKDSKMALMEDVISNLMEQNENLLETFSELMQYKQMVYSLMSKKPNTALLPQ
ncbi:hypothetical protein TYRP_010583, partial [Tyrophagus putrescentiae]